MSLSSSLHWLDNATYLDVGVCAGAAITLVALYMKNRNRYLRPPGPKGLPMVGNIFDVPSKRQWVQYVNWSHEFGMCYVCVVRSDLDDMRLSTPIGSPIIQLNMLGTTVIVLNNLEGVTELFEKRGNVYLTRSVFTFYLFPHIPEAYILDVQAAYAHAERSVSLHLWLFKLLPS